jgi:hypothetical protein
MNASSPSMERLMGVYEGTGSWHDAAGKSQSYRVKQSNVATAEGFHVVFHHDFDDGTVVDARVEMTWLAPHLFRVSVGGSDVGNGYTFDGYCHYHLNVGEAYVEVNYQSSADGLGVFGSSTKNAEGLYIAWREVLRRGA